MRILFINYGGWDNNSSHHILRFAEGLAERGHHCCFAAQAGADVAVPPALTSEDAPVSARRARDLLRGEPAFADGQPPDIIHLWTPREINRRFLLNWLPDHAPQARVLFHLEDNETVLYERFRAQNGSEEDEPTPDGLTSPKLLPHLLALADGVTCIAPALREFVPAHVPSLLLPPALATENFDPPPLDPAIARQLKADEENCRLIIYPGHTTFANLEDMICLYTAIHLLREQGMSVRLVRTGEDSVPLHAHLPFDPRPFLVPLGFLPYHAIPALLTHADVLIQPGQADAFNEYRLPSKIPEFLASGRPVILPRANIGNILEDGKNAYLFTGADAPALSRRIGHVLENPADAEQVGRAGRDFARAHFDKARLSEQLETFYKGLRDQENAPGFGSVCAPNLEPLSLPEARWKAGLGLFRELAGLADFRNEQFRRENRKLRKKLEKPQPQPTRGKWFSFLRRRSQGTR